MDPALLIIVVVEELVHVRLEPDKDFGVSTALEDLVLEDRDAWIEFLEMLFGALLGVTCVLEVSGEFAQSSRVDSWSLQSTGSCLTPVSIVAWGLDNCLRIARMVPSCVMPVSIVAWKPDSRRRGA
jgi:hypothetical protein